VTTPGRWIARLISSLEYMSWKNLRTFLHARSISFRLYLIIIPTTILAISLFGYLDARFAIGMLDRQVEENTLRVAGQLAEDLSRKDFPGDLPGLHKWIGELVETNFYIGRIDVYRAFDGGVTRIETTSTSEAEPVTADERTAVRQSRPMVVPQSQANERLLKAIAPISTPRGVVGCVSVTSTLRQSDLVGEVHNRIALFLIPGSALVLVLMLHFSFTRVITRRIDRLIRVMTQAGRGSLEKRAQVETEDELGIIAQRFNGMMEEIELASRERDRLLEQQKDFNAQLQGKVGEATLDLSAANEQLRQVNQDLVETQRRLNRFERTALAGQVAATFAHEIGSPLSAISTHLQLMAEDRALSDDARPRLRLIQDQVKRITGFVEELLSETRVSSQARSAVQLNGLLRELLLFLEQHLARQQIRIESCFDPDLPEIDANPQQLQQVFLNLLNNASDALPRGGNIRVETRVDPDTRAFAIVSIADNGIGIPEEKQGRIFEPFFTTKDLRRGTGLGLSIAARIIREHKGTIELYSAPEMGTTFTIRFPASVPHAAAVVGGMRDSHSAFRDKGTKG